MTDMESNMIEQEQIVGYVTEPAAACVNALQTAALDSTNSDEAAHQAQWNAVLALIRHELEQDPDFVEMVNQKLSHTGWRLLRAS
jgi:hypothetical protein